MRLLRLEEGRRVVVTGDLVHNIPPYVILSHTWGGPGDEVTLQDIERNEFEHKPGYHKILFCGEQAQRENVEHFWVDTCCIDKTSSAELSEAINSMYRWYQSAVKCYVYLSDVSASSDSDTQTESTTWLHSFQQSRWFSRGWTLQELIAPPVVEFYSSNRQRLGDRTTLEQTIHDITKIPVSALRGNWQSDIEPHSRVSWCFSRATMRPEDKAYSLLGLLGLSMPAIYGEGQDRAFARLYQELIQRYHNYSHDTLLTLVAKCGHIDAAPWLLQRNIEIDARNGKDNSPLACAAYEGQEEMVEYLLDHGADVNSKNNQGCSPLAFAASGGHQALLEILLDRGANIEATSDKGVTVLEAAAIRGQQEVVRLLCARGAKIDAKDDNGLGALTGAALAGHEAVIKILLSQGADIESKGPVGVRPLGGASFRNHKAVVQLLLDKGANVDSEDDNGASPLVWAVFSKHEEVVQLLLDNGAKLNSTHYRGVRPLELASTGGNERIVRLLLDKGADFKQSTRKRCLDAARKGGHQEVVQLLLEKQDEVRQSAQINIYSGFARIFSRVGKKSS